MLLCKNRVRRDSYTLFGIGVPKIANGEQFWLKTMLLCKIVFLELVTHFLVRECQKSQIETSFG